MTASDDPYGYGQPPAVEYGNKYTGRAILNASWSMLKQDRQMIVLPLLGTLFGLIAAAVLFVPGWFLGHAIGDTNKVAGIAGLVLASYAATVTGLYFQAAVVIAANERADGRTPTLEGVLAAAWSIRGRIFAWAVVSTTVGLLLRALENRLGFLGKLLAVFGGLAWAVASFFALPVVVVEGTGPIEAVRRSAHVIRRTWGTSLRTTLRGGLIQVLLLLPGIFLVVLGLGTLGSGHPAVGVLLSAVGFVWVLTVGTVFSAIYTYAQTLIYRYAIGRAVPAGTAELLGGAFTTKRRR